MNNGSQPREDSYDVIVVGSGLGGLSAGAFLAKAGKKVLVIERLEGPGGYAHAFRRDSYMFDPAIHAIGECEPGGDVDTWLLALGVRDRVTMLPMDPFYTVVLEDFVFTAPMGVEPYTEALIEAFPADADGIRRFMAECLGIKHAYDSIRRGGSWEDLAGGPGPDLEVMMEYRKKSSAAVFDEYFTDPRLKSTVSAMWSYEGAPPSRLSFLSFAGMLTSLLEYGVNYCQGTFQSLANALVAALQENGGELVVITAVDRILIEGGNVVGVELAGGDRILAPVVVSNADARLTCEQLVGPEHFPESYMKRLRSMTLSPSAFLIYMATDMDLRQFGFAEEIFTYNCVDYDEAWQRMLQGEASVIGYTLPSLVDPSLAPEGECIVTALAILPYDIGVPWSEAKDRYTETIMERAETLFPGLSGRLTFTEAATPLALERYTLNSHGAMYGWENTPGQTGARRLANKTPVEGLYLASAWSRPGSGTVNAMMAGLQTAQMIVGYADRAQFLGRLNPQMA